jgi:hypothetical protein
MMVGMTDRVQGFKVDEDGRLLVNSTEGSSTDSATEGSGSLSAGVASATLLAANESRVGARIFNRGAARVWLGYGEAAVVNQGIPLEANGGYILEDDFTGAINVISEAADNLVTFVEL